LRRYRDPEINIPSALISWPDVESSRAGRQAGEEDRQAKIVSEGAEVRVEQVRRIQQQVLSEHDTVGRHVAPGYNELIAEAQGAHEAAGHRLELANAAVEEAGVKLLGAVRKRDATTEQVTRLVDPGIWRQFAAFSG
jgi:hypothetical protein